MLVKTAPPTKEEIAEHYREEKEFALELANRIEEIAKRKKLNMNWVVNRLRLLEGISLSNYMDDALDTYHKISK